MNARPSVTPPPEGERPSSARAIALERRDLEDREDARTGRMKPRVHPALDPLILEPSQHRFVRDGLGSAHRVRDVKVRVVGQRRPFSMSVTWRKRLRKESWSLVLEAPLRGLPRLYADTALAATDPLATAIAVELVHRFGDTFAALSSARGGVRLAIHGEPFTEELARRAVLHLVEIVAAARARLEQHPRLAQPARDVLNERIARTEILERERESAFARFEAAFAAWRAPPPSDAIAWRSGVFEPGVRVAARGGAIEVGRHLRWAEAAPEGYPSAPWPDLLVRTGEAPPDLAVTPTTDPGRSTLLRVLRTRVRGAGRWCADARGRTVPCVAEFSFERGVSRLVVIPGTPAGLAALLARGAIALRWQFLALESDVMRFHDAVRNGPRSPSAPIGYERLFGPLAAYRGEVEPEPRRERALTSRHRPEGWR